MANIFGNISNPTSFNGPSGFFDFLSVIFKLIGTFAGIYFVIQIILAGFKYISANGDDKRIASAWATIWQSIIGIFIVACAFLLASAIGKITGIDPTNPTIYGPGSN